MNHQKAQSNVIESNEAAVHSTSTRSPANAAHSESPTEVPDAHRRRVGLALLGFGTAALSGCLATPNSDRRSSEDGDDFEKISSALSGGGPNEMCDTVITDLKPLNPSFGTNLWKVVLVAGRDARGDGGGGVFYWSPSDASPEDFGTVFTSTFPGANGRWRRLYDGPLNVKWFGTGVNVDLGIQRAVAVAARGAELYFPPGDYVINQPIVLDGSNTFSICGKIHDVNGNFGSRIVVNPTGSIISSVFAVGNATTGGAYSFQIRNLAILCNQKANAGIDAARMGGVAETIFEALFVENAVQYGFKFSRCQTIVVRRCAAKYYGIDGFYIEGCNATLFEQLRAYGSLTTPPTGYGIRVLPYTGDGNGACNIRNAIIEGKCAASGGAILIGAVSGPALIENAWIEITGGAYIVLDGTQWTHVINNWIAGQAPWTTAKNAVLLRNNAYGNHIANNRGANDARIIELNGSCSYNRIIDNEIVSNVTKTAMTVTQNTAQNEVKRNLIGAGPAAPTSGSWQKGDIVMNDDPASTEYVGWVYTAAGWKGFGTIA